MALNMLLAGQPSAGDPGVALPSPIALGLDVTKAAL